MALPFIAFHMADYQRDTMQLPLEGHGAYFLLLQHCWTHGRIPTNDASRAAICKVPVQRWRKQLAPLVAGYFDENGENKRATAEIAKAEKLRIRQAMAGHNGGVEAAKRKAERIAMAKPPPSHGQAAVKPRHSHGEATLEKKDITSTFSEAAREVPPVENPENPQKPPPEPEETPVGSPAKGTNLAASPELLATLARKYR